MEPLYEYAWLIPVFPLAGAMLVGLGLISLNKFTNGLREINAVLIMSLMGAAISMSFALLVSQFQGHPVYIRSFEYGLHDRSSDIIHVGDCHNCCPIGDDLHPRVYVSRSWVCQILCLSESI